MRILIINPIVYTSETSNIKKNPFIKDSMIYDLCLAFHKAGHTVELFAAEPYKPTQKEQSPFKIIWGKCIAPKIFQPHRFPVLKGLFQYIKSHKNEIDLIISSEIFSINSLIAYWTAKEKLIVWHELAVHNALFEKIPSKIWYNIVARFFMKNVRVVARSENAKAFIGRYCSNVSETIIDHGVNLDKFQCSENKTNSFIVASQLIARKRIDGILEYFAEYLQKYDPKAMLYIAGEGELDKLLREQMQHLQIEKNVRFMGKLNHNDLRTVLAEAQAMLINTVKDNSMISIVESIAVGTPVVTTDIPLNSRYIQYNRLGIAKKEWNEDDLNEIVVNNHIYRGNCMDYRECLSTEYKVKQFIMEAAWNS